MLGFCRRKTDEEEATAGKTNAGEPEIGGERERERGRDERRRSGDREMAVERD